VAGRHQRVAAIVARPGDHQYRGLVVQQISRQLCRRQAGPLHQVGNAVIQRAFLQLPEFVAKENRDAFMASSDPWISFKYPIND